MRSSAGRCHLAVIVSWGDSCGQVNKLGVYINVMKFTKWPEKIISSKKDSGNDSSIVATDQSQQSLVEWVPTHSSATKYLGTTTDERRVKLSPTNTCDHTFIIGGFFC